MEPNYRANGLIRTDATVIDAVCLCKYSGKELITFGGYDAMDYHARWRPTSLTLFSTPDPLGEDFTNTSLYTYCGGDPVNKIDPSGCEWNYYISQGVMMIVCDVVFSVSPDLHLSQDQIQLYQNVINNQFNATLNLSSDGMVCGQVRFHSSDSPFKQQLFLYGNFPEVSAGSTSLYYSNVNILDNDGKIRSNELIGEDAVHEMLHTLRLDHPFENTQTSDTELLKDGANSYKSTNNTDPQIASNIMNYRMINVDGKISPVHNLLTKGQIDFIIKEIDLQNSNDHIYNGYEGTEYWLNWPGTEIK